MHISLLVQQNEALLLALFQKAFQTETYKAKSKHSQTACPSDTFTQCLWPGHHQTQWDKLSFSAATPLLYRAAHGCH